MLVGPSGCLFFLYSKLKIRLDAVNFTLCKQKYELVLNFGCILLTYALVITLFLIYVS